MFTCSLMQTKLISQSRATTQACRVLHHVLKSLTCMLFIHFLDHLACAATLRAKIVSRVLRLPELGLKQQTNKPTNDSPNMARVPKTRWRPAAIQFRRSAHPEFIYGSHSSIWWMARPPLTRLTFKAEIHHTQGRTGHHSGNIWFRLYTRVVFTAD